MPKVSADHLQARRRQILDGARSSFARHGYEGATVRVLEEEIGLSRGAIFHHFPDKDALFMALAPSADDVWLYWMHRLTGSRPEKVGGRYRIIEWPGTQQQNLRGLNLAGDGKDRAVRAMIARYGFPPAEGA